MSYSRVTTRCKYHEPEVAATYHCRGGGGHLVAVSSLASYVPLPASAAYCAPKAGLDMLMECLRIDLVGTGVHVTNIRAGFVRTRMVATTTHPMPGMMEPDEAARRILEGLERAPAEIVFPRWLAAMARSSGRSPGRCGKLCFAW